MQLEHHALGITHRPTLSQPEHLLYLFIDRYGGALSNQRFNEVDGGYLTRIQYQVFHDVNWGTMNQPGWRRRDRRRAPAVEFAWERYWSTQSLYTPSLSQETKMEIHIDKKRFIISPKILATYQYYPSTTLPKMNLLKRSPIARENAATIHTKTIHYNTSTYYLFNHTLHSTQSSHLINTCTYYLFNHPTVMATPILDEDEAFIRSFIGLTTADEPATAIVLSSRATTSTDWGKCLLLKVITDKAIMDNAFLNAMSRAWAMDTTSVIKQVTRNCYLAQFENTNDHSRVLMEGPWTFRGDLVAMATVKSHKDLSIQEIHTADIWIQFFNIPINSLTEEGAIVLAKEVGIPLTGPVEGFVNGRPFTKLKVRIQIKSKCKDHVRLTHPDLGVFTVHCVYEKLARICRFCGLIGHEMATCPDRMRLISLLQTPAYKTKYNSTELLSPKKGAWICNPGLVPNPEHDTQQPEQSEQTAAPKPKQRPNLKRPFHNSGPSEIDLTQKAIIQTDNLITPPHDMDFSFSDRNATVHQPLNKKPKPARQNSPASHI